MSAIRMVSNFCAWLTFSVGTSLNLILIGLIRRYTPKSTQIYSKILLQTCITDLMLLFVALLADPSYFFTANGEIEFILNGIWQTQNPAMRSWNLAILVIWHFLTYVSLFGFVNQFIYRYLILNWDKRPSSTFYFATFVAILMIPLAFSVVLAIEYYPPDGREFLSDPAVANILNINLTEETILLAAHSPGTPLLTASFYYIIVTCTIAYGILCVLGYLMLKNVKNQPFNQHFGNFLTKFEQKKNAELNHQITRNLLIQAALPFTIYGPLLFGLLTIVTGIDLGTFGQYFFMLEPVPMFFPPALNPFVTIFIIKHYRLGLFGEIKFIYQTFCRHYQQNGAKSTIVQPA